MNEDEFTDYLIQLSIEESCHEAFVIANSSTSDENLKLLAAIETGDTAVIRELRQFPSAFKEVDSRGLLPLHRAAVQPSAKVLEAILVSSQADLEEKGRNGETALTLAVQAGLEENVRILLEHGALPHNPNSKKESPLLLAVRVRSYQMVYALIAHGAVVDQVCLKRWTALHEAAQVGCVDILMLLLRRGGQTSVRDCHGVTPLSVAAECANLEVLQVLIESGADVNAQSYKGESVLMDAAGSGNPDCVEFLLEHGASPNLASLTGHLPIHRAAFEGHYLVLKILLSVTSKTALKESGQSPIHSAADGGHAQCLQLLIDRGFDVNVLLDQTISDNYSDMRRSALYFAVSNGDVTCTEMLLNAGAKPDLDPLHCLLVAVRARRYEIVRILLASQADVNCYFTEVNNTVFPTALQYCLKDEEMMRLLLNNGYDVDKCFHCHHDLHFNLGFVWRDIHLHKPGCVTCDGEDKIPFCDFMSLCCLVDLSGRVLLILLDYVSHVTLCSRLRSILEKQKEWEEIYTILRKMDPSGDLDDEDELLDAAIQLSIQESCKDIASLGSVEHQKILDAIFRGDLFALQELSDYPAAFTEVDSKGWYPIHRAAVQQSVQVLEMVLYGSYRLSLEEETANGETPLILATQAGLVEIVRTLLEHGASPNRINSKNESPLLLAVRTDSFEIAFTLISRGASVNQACPRKWTAIHEAAKVGCTDILTLLLQHGGNVSETDEHGVTPMGIAAEYGQPEALDILIHYGGDVNAQAPNGDSVLYDAAGSGNPDCIELLLQHGADPNVANLSLELPIHRAAYKGHYLVLRMLIPITTRRALRLTGQSPIHAAADGGYVRCMELLVDRGFNVNALLDTHVSEKYGDMRKTPLYFAVSNGDVTGTQLLLNAGAKTNLDPLHCLLVAVRAGRYEIVRILLASQADVNCYFTEVNDTVFPTALQYCLRDEMMMRLLLNSGYEAEKCFCCPHDSTWGRSSEHTSEKIPFCDFISVSWLVQFSGRAVRVLLDYVNHVPICSKLKMVLKRHKEWAEISEIL
ncbi:hypothetical protein QQF64_023014, partial [Cirrhinus molitorella]